MARCDMKSIVAGLVLVMLAAAAAAAQLPRPSPEFALTPPGGNTLLLSSLKGKVVVMEFLFVRSAHGLRVARMWNNLEHEFAPRGFQSVAVALDRPNNAGAGAQSVAAMATFFK